MASKTANIRSMRFRRANNCSSRSSVARASIAGVVSFIAVVVMSVPSLLVDGAAEHRVRAGSGVRVHDVHHFRAAAVEAGVAAKQGDAAREAQLAVAVVEIGLSRGEAVEETRFVPVLVEHDARARKTRCGGEDVGLLPPLRKVARAVDDDAGPQ